jgi:hypothetical protein
MNKYLLFKINSIKNIKTNEIILNILFHITVNMIFHFIIKKLMNLRLIIT